MNNSIGFTTVCGFNISRGNICDHARMIQNLCREKTGAWIVTLNTEMLSRVASDLSYEKLLRRADLYVADGMPIVWVGNIKSPDSKIAGRTTGVDLIERILRFQYLPPFAIIGGTDPATALKKYPGTEKQCKYIFTGIVDLSDRQIEKIVRKLVTSNVSLVFLSLGVPKQDQLASLIRERLPELVVIGIGGTFDLLSSTVKRAPVWMQKYGMEWFYRLCKEPARLWKRYLLRYPVGVMMLIKDCFRRK